MEYIHFLRSKVGTAPLLLAGAAVALLDEEDRILLQRRTDTGNWGLAGGLMEPGESPEETARREVLEETGLHIGNLELITVLSGREFYTELPNGDRFYPVTVIYLSRDIRDGRLHADGTEGGDVRYFRPDHLPEPITLIFRRLLERFPHLAGR